MKARDVVTAGWLEVHGDLSVTGHLVGDYNDCSALVSGDVRAGLFYPEEHHFEVGGTFEADHAIGNPYRIEAKNTVEMIGLDDPRVLELVDRALLTTYDEEDEAGNPIVAVDGFADFGAVKKRVRSGEGIAPR